MSYKDDHIISQLRLIDHYRYSIRRYLLLKYSFFRRILCFQYILIQVTALQILELHMNLAVRVVDF